ncbi:DNA methylase, partial [human gut metagenome]
MSGRWGGTGWSAGDSTKAETFSLLMDGLKANLVITDPPYNVNYEGSAGKIKNDNMENAAFYDFLLAAFQNTAEAMADDASIYVLPRGYRGTELPKGVLGRRLLPFRDV